MQDSTRRYFAVVVKTAGHILCPCPVLCVTLSTSASMYSSLLISILFICHSSSAYGEVRFRPVALPSKLSTSTSPNAVPRGSLIITNATSNTMTTNILSFRPRPNLASVTWYIVAAKKELTEKFSESSFFFLYRSEKKKLVKIDLLLTIFSFLSSVETLI